MPIATDSGYLPDWLAALIGQGGAAVNAPAGLFSETAASSTPNIGLLSSLPQFTGVQPNAPAFQGGNAPNGPLPDQSPTFSYMSSSPPWGGSGPSNSYPSMTLPQDPWPMNIGPGGAAPSFAGVSPNAPFTANGPTLVQDQYANVPLPPRRPNDPTSFQAQAGSQDINAPPPGRPNSNVIGTEASGAPEVTAQKSLGLGDYLGKAANAIGGIYGAGGPGDALIAMGLANRTGGASIQALNAMNANRVADVKLQLLKNQLALQGQQQNATYNYLKSKGAPEEVAKAATLDPAVLKNAMETYDRSTKTDLVNIGGKWYQRDPYETDPAKSLTLIKSGPAGDENQASTEAQPGVALTDAQKKARNLPTNDGQNWFIDEKGAPFVAGGKAPEQGYTEKSVDQAIAGLPVTKVAAQAGVQTKMAISRAQKALDEGAIVGPSANLDLNARQIWAGVFGLPDTAVTKTQEFKAAIASKTAALARQLSNTGHTSNADILQGAMQSGGDITNNKEAIKAIFEGQKELADDAIRNHNQVLDALHSRIPGAKLPQLYGVQEPDYYQSPQPITSAPSSVSGGLPEGARKAPDGNFYVPDSGRPGKYLRWVQ